MTPVRRMLRIEYAPAHHPKSVASAISTPRIDAEKLKKRYAAKTSPSAAACGAEPVLRPRARSQRHVVPGNSSSEVVLAVQWPSTPVVAANSSRTAEEST